MIAIKSHNSLTKVFINAPVLEGQVDFQSIRNGQDLGRNMAKVWWGMLTEMGFDC